MHAVPVRVLRRQGSVQGLLGKGGTRDFIFYFSDFRRF
jgi:hypothetical protein